MADYKMKVRRSGSGISDKTTYAGYIQNDRILSKRETYDHLVEVNGATKSDHAAVWKWVMEMAKKCASKGNALRISGLGVFRNKVKGSFETSVGPWTKGKNMILTECYELSDFRNAIDGASVENVTTGDKVVIKSILNTELEEYGVCRIGDVMSMAGQNLAPDVEKSDELVGLYSSDGKTLLCKATITKSSLNVVEFKFEGVSLAAGTYKIGIFTRCGESDGEEAVALKSDFMNVTLALAA